jgi:hypothetical protein
MKKFIDIIILKTKNDKENVEKIIWKVSKDYSKDSL